MINNKDWQTYVDTGEIHAKYLQEIADHIKQGRSLSTKELAIYGTHHQIIEALLK